MKYKFWNLSLLKGRVRFVEEVLKLHKKKMSLDDIRAALKYNSRQQIHYIIKSNSK